MCPHPFLVIKLWSSYIKPNMMIGRVGDGRPQLSE